jgi:hypothetical protein
VLQNENLAAGSYQNNSHYLMEWRPVFTCCALMQEIVLSAKKL